MVIGDIRADSASSRGYWLWVVADNLRLLARNAVRIAEEAARVRP
jgi:aspartate-semialdehyde dehydrogenase